MFESGQKRKSSIDPYYNIRGLFRWLRLDCHSEAAATSQRVDSRLDVIAEADQL